MWEKAEPIGGVKTGPSTKAEDRRVRNVEIVPGTKTTAHGSGLPLSMVLGFSFAPSTRWVQLIGGAKTGPSTKAEE